MNFDDTPQEAAFRKEVRNWISANKPNSHDAGLKASVFGNPAIESGDVMQASKDWQKKKYDAGWACLHWPKEYGGRSASPIERIIWQQEEGIYAALSMVFVIGIGMCGPTIMQHGTEQQKKHLVSAIASGEHIWCQLFSEPAGGSDLAGLRTKATRDGDEWIVNGQKIWTSGAHYADYGMLVARTDPSAPKHKGLTMFMLDMRAPGVEIRPIKQVNGQSGFNEVYFSDVRISDSQRLGNVGEGWSVALTMLMNERLSIGSSMPTGFSELLNLCTNLEVDGIAAIDNPAVRSQLARFSVRESGLKYTALRTITALSKGETPGPESSITKLVAGSMMQEIAMLALDLQAQAGALVGPEHAADGGRFQAMLLRSPGTRIEGGTDEILRNIIAERVLGLPADIRVDKGVPFNSIPQNKR